ncbi:FxSxx-COOH system tetratricopeptide repeat protein [Kibdelosporangium philippinense]|uniref:FxSxx-COOH system tetratricopeptide repeat protein n=1 Tax=Kibdelosporangium philippinense TaxID=211113 RepID=A0ABS8ZJH2_9PSEU|nr:FxSxx-COOH system tetratricopeptide repeat protein [Kibdelosporangium philippinense]MCE7007939.1 FxSxx-COOH system tetratricopeptide repeat protein [Kibdelosporangium philippinense]
MWPLAGLGRRRDVWQPVVETLEQVQVLRDPIGRGLCLDLVAQHLGLPLQVRHFPSTRQHIYSILLACDQHPGALSAFLRVLGELEPRSRAVSWARQMLGGDVPRQRGAVRTEHPVVWGEIPPRACDFTPLAQQLADIRDRSPAVLIGPGKSELAIEYAYRRATDHEIVWWIPAAHPTQVRIALVKLALRLKLPVEPSVRAAVPAVLDALRTRNSLLIFDNAERIDDVRPFFPTGPGHVVVTSHTPARNALDVSWPRETPDTDCEDALKVCAFFADAPISRALFAGMDPVMLSRAIRQAGARGLAKVDHRTDTFQLTSRIPHDELHRRDAHALLAQADPNDPENVANWSRYADLLPHMLASGVADSGDPQVRRSALNMANFLSTWGHPDDARAFAKSLVDRWRDGSREALVASRWLARSSRQAGLFEEASRIGESTVSRSRENLGSDHEDTLLSAQSVAEDLCAAGEFVSGMALGKFAYQRARSAFGEDDPDTLEAATKYAAALRLCGDFDAARTLNEDAAERKTDLLGENHRSTLSTLSSWALDLIACGRWLEACQVQEDTVQRLRDHVGIRHAMTLRATGTLSAARRLAGDAANALPLGQVALDGLIGRYGESAPEAISAAMNVSVALRQLGRLEEARRLGLHVHALAQRAWGQHHPFTLAAATNVAVTLHVLGELSTARGLNEKAMNRMRSALGEDHPFSLVCAANLANDLARAGQYAAARDLGNDTLERARRGLPADHPYASFIATNLALHLRGLGQLDESAELQKQSVASLRASLGAGHPATKAAAENLRIFCTVDII